MPRGWHGESRRHSLAAKKGWKKRRYWIRDAVKEGREGALSRQLGVPVEENIPVTLLERIKNASIGETVRNPTETGKRRVRVTRLLKRRAVLAHTLKTKVGNR